MLDNKTISRIFFFAAIMGFLSSIMFFVDGDFYQGIFYIVMAFFDTLMYLVMKKKSKKDKLQ